MPKIKIRYLAEILGSPATPDGVTTVGKGWPVSVHQAKGEETHAGDH